ncbi:DNA cytosine methyltransferase [Clostridium estertheticum]|uniref:DNA cytosine methyltransferase n=1 Tax=Clostridium estertheticum TaxID=238834 RepID=UPI001C0AB9DB|nr:DNA cytosine methyltransferase [Clostridium estertheticum]MBU3186631.1 DNA cytosine methyltransferase [Clostridium estertheticum]
MGINVLSLFDGMSGGQLALERAGIAVDKYYASEIKPHSMQTTQKNYPDTIQLGDVTLLKDNRLKELKSIDLLIGGSPCTNLTITVCNNYDHNQGLKGEESKLFFEYIRIKNLLNPKYFLLENVASMTDENKNIITDLLGVEPVFIDSNVFSAQDRGRYYWTNIPLDLLPENKGIVLKDIMETDADEKYYYKKGFKFNGWDKKVIATLEINSHDIGKRVYNPNMRCGTLTAINGGYHEKKVYDNERCRKLTPIEYERLQTVPDGYTEGVSDTKRRSMLGDGWTIDVIAYLFKNIEQ